MPLDNLSMLDQSAVRYYKSFINFIDIQSKTYADRVFIRYYLNKTYKTLTYAQVDVITTNLACKWASKKKRTGVISYINDHNVDYMITMIALMKLRVVQLSVSPRNSEAAIVNLLEKTQSKALFVTPKYEFIANDVAAKMKNVEVIVIEPFDIEAMLKQPLDERHKELIDYNFTEQDLDKPALIIHR
ncbi:hypothetical protein G6F56_011636 [Rhizopus delemar]|nr:hypothetical protein G6F56_011636 [Rhizopus delemar]